jgi:hypothetical protein
VDWTELDHLLAGISTAGIGAERLDVDERLDSARNEVRTVQFCDVRVVLESPFKDNDSAQRQPPEAVREPLPADLAREHGRASAYAWRPCP